MSPWWRRFSVGWSALSGVGCRRWPCVCRRRKPGLWRLVWRHCFMPCWPVLPCPPSAPFTCCWWPDWPCFPVVFSRPAGFLLRRCWLSCCSIPGRCWRPASGCHSALWAPCFMLLLPVRSKRPAGGSACRRGALCNGRRLWLRCQCSCWSFSSCRWYRRWPMRWRFPSSALS